MTRSDPVEAGPARALRALLFAMIVLGAMFAASQYSDPWAEKAWWRKAFESAAFLPLQLGTAVGLTFASRRAALPDGTRRGLRHLAVAFGFVATGSLLWSLAFLRGIEVRYISALDFVYFGFYPFVILGLTALPGVDRAASGVRDALGWVVVTTAFGGLTVFALKVDPSLAEMTASLRALVFATSAAQLAALITVNRAIERARRIPSTRAAALVVGALGLAVVGDLVFQILFATGYTGQNFNVAIAIASNLLVLRGAVAFAEDPIPPSDAETAPDIPFSPLPIIAVTAVALLVVWMTSTGYATGTGSLLAALVGLNALLVLRDVFTSRAAATALAVGAQRHAERQAERRLAALVRHASDAILLVDPRGALVFASAPADRLFDTPLAGREGRPVSDLIPDDERDAWDRFLASLAAQPGQAAPYVWRLHTADGSERTIESIGIDLRNEPAVGGTVLNLRDVTERTSLEERLRQAQKLEVAGRLAGGVAHDFNNVLTAVITGAELAQLALEPDHPVQEDLAAIGASAQRGAALTRRLLAFVRHEPVPAQRIDLADTLTELEPLLARLAGESHQVETELVPALGAIEVDRHEFEHIIFNLVANARDAMPHGGRIALRAEVLSIDSTPSGDRWVIAPPPGRFAAISVRDTGAGMSTEVRKRMFDPFYTQKTGGRGTGLGLIGVRPLVEGAKGGVCVESAPEAGTMVTLLLPVSDGEPQSRRSGGARAAGGGETAGTGSATPRPARAGLPIVNPGVRRILLVEDETDVRDQLARLLDALGYAPVAVPSAADARGVLAREGHGIVAVVSDVMMPGETGLEFAAWLRADHPGLPIMLISGHTGTALDRAARISGDIPLLRKPFSRAELGDQLAALLAPR